MARWFAIACSCLAGCSFALSGPSADRPRARPPECDTGKGLVLLDAITASGLELGALALASSNNSSEHGLAAVPALVGALYAVAALRGSSTADACRAAMADYSAGGEPGPEPTPVPRNTIVAAPKPPAAKPPQPQPEPKPDAKPEPGRDQPWRDFWKEAM